MQNKANFQNTKNELNPLYDKGLQEKIGAFDVAKTNPNEPIFSPAGRGTNPNKAKLVPPALECRYRGSDLSAEALAKAEVEGSRSFTTLMAGTIIV